MHGSGSYRVPWNYGEEAVKITSKMIQAKHRLMPYLFGQVSKSFRLDTDSQAIKARQTGVPVLRPMVLEFPSDPATAYLDRQYMLGESLLVAPVFSETRATYYLPAGKWTDLWTGAVIEGPKWVVEEDCPLGRIPVFVRPNTVLVLGPKDVKIPDYKYAEVELEVTDYELTESVTVDVPVGLGEDIAGQVSIAPGGKPEGKGLKLVQGNRASFV